MRTTPRKLACDKGKCPYHVITMAIALITCAQQHLVAPLKQAWVEEAIGSMSVKHQF